MDLGRVGIWTFQLELVPLAAAREHVAELDELGFGALWLPEAVGREAFTQAALLLGASEHLVVATGVAQIWARDAMAAAAAHKTITDAYPERFLLGLGVSHQPAVEGLRGQTYARPYSAMVDYLDGMDRALFMASPPSATPRRVLAALGPRMLKLAAERTDGAFPYNVTPEHTAFARETMGDGPLLAVEQAVALTTDPEQARALGRRHLSIYLGLPNYENNLRRFGFGDADFADGGSDRLVDALVAWGDLDTIAARVREHHDAGADHVCVQVVPERGSQPPVAEWRELATALLP